MALGRRSQRVAAPDPIGSGRFCVQGAAETALTFQIDVTTGGPSGFVGTTTLTGTVEVLANLDVTVGGATLGAHLVDDGARSALAEAAAAGVPATVTIDGVGSIDQDTGEVTIVLTFSVDFTLPASVPAQTQAPVVLLPDTAMSPSP